MADLLAQRPEENSTNTGQMTIRDAEGTEKEIPVTFAVLSRQADWLNTYVSGGAAGIAPEQLSILHNDAQPNQYWLGRGSAAAASGTNGVKLTPEQTMVPFAGSDFWIADLGLEFLHWPRQLLLKQEMRRSRSCNVLASYNPHVAPGAYSRVVSWLDIESGGIVLAQAFDSRDKLLKEFAPKEMKKIQGQWQLEEMEIRNMQTGSRTRVQFNLGR
ncbi:MAG: outer membrane lipoprotein-sorting protein [Limisphaerales bacterium]